VCVCVCVCVRHHHETYRPCRLRVRRNGGGAGLLHVRTAAAADRGDGGMSATLAPDVFERRVLDDDDG